MLDKLQMADLHYRRGVVLEQAGRIVEAVEEYRQALQDNPRLRAAHVAIANYYMRNGLTAKAVDAWTAVVNIEADYEAQANLASALIDLQRYEEARVLLHECLRWVPDDAFASFELAYIDYTEDQYTAAYQRLLDLRPIYNDEWQLHHLLGNCQVKLGLYDSALASFGRAALLVTQDDHLEDIQASIEMVERYAEFATITNDKEHLYAEHGLVVLGSLPDNGLEIEQRIQVDWDFTHIAATLCRLVKLQERGIWSCTAVIALNRSAEPLARALAQHLNQPLVKLDTLQVDDIALVVCGLLDNGRMLEVIDEQLPCPSVVLALTMAWKPLEQDTLPDIIGLRATKATLPWESTLATLRQHNANPHAIEQQLHEATTSILEAWNDLPPDPTGSAQAAWYRDLHPHINLPGSQL